MDFALTDELEDLLERTQSLMTEAVYPVEAEALRSFESALPALLEAREAVKAAGLWAPQMPRELGGMGLGFLDHAVMSEVLGKSPLGHFVFGCQAPDAGNQEILLEFGTDAQKAEWLAPLVRGDIRSCFGMTEPDRAGSSPTWLDTRALRDGDHYVIDGHKWFTTGAHGAALCIVMAVTNPDAPPHLRASQLLVPTDTPGFEHVRRTPVMGDEGFGWSSHSEIRLTGCRVPVSNRLGAEGAGFLIAQARLGPGRIHHCMRWLGICERAFELMCERAATREIAPGKPLATRQVVQHWIADSRAEIDAARLSVRHAAWKIDAEGARAARQEISCIKFLVAGTLQRVVDRALQVHGGLGMTDYTPLAWFYRHERAARIYDGADEVHKSVVARRELERFGFDVRAGRSAPE
ncbi:MAG: acyl-CoA dehydrogenase family protein [Myxococcales bacterium]|nr:acyl-CoA dehydrogenase family protein [Myxococcales bacterium]